MSGLAIAVGHCIAAACDPALPNDQADQALCRTFASNLLERRPAHKIEALVQLDDPPEAGFERIGSRVELVAVKGHASLEAQRVPGAQAAREHALSLARLYQGGPQLI